MEMLIKARCKGEMVPVDKELNEMIERGVDELDVKAGKMDFVKKGYDEINEFFIELMGDQLHELLY